MYLYIYIFICIYDVTRTIRSNATESSESCLISFTVHCFAVLNAYNRIRFRALCSTSLYCTDKTR